MSKARLIEAVKHLDIEATRQILDAKPALLQVITPNGRNLLHVACTASCVAHAVPESRAVKMVKMLLDHGVDVDELGLSGRDPCPPLFFAVAFGRNPAVVKYLLDRLPGPEGAYGSAPRCREGVRPRTPRLAGEARRLPGRRRSHRRHAPRESVAQAR